MSQVDDDRATPPLLEMRGIVKSFPGVRALDGVDLQVRAGEVHCLLGQNGAGKSTLIKVMAGAHQVDAGVVLWEGRPVQLASPVAALRQGIATIYQELDLVDWLTVGENIFLGHELARAGFSQRAATLRRSRELLDRLGHREISASREVGTLSAAGKQIVSIARALSRDARLIVMDEPSAVLDGEEVQNLFKIVDDLAAAGVAVVYISHRLEEIRRIGDRITVLKDGRSVASGLDAHATPTAELIRLMTGRSIEYVFPPRLRKPPATDTEPLLSVRGLTRRGEFADIDFDVRPGEIIGLAGLVGAGRSEIVETVFGARRADRGQVTVAGRLLPNGSVRAAVDAGVGLCPEERKFQGLLLDQPVYQNISLASLRRFAAAGFSRAAGEKTAAMAVAATVHVHPADPDRPVRTLSGGNQQKVLLARWLLHECRVLLLDEPTRGVDVGARTEIYALVRQLDGAGGRGHALGSALAWSGDHGLARTQLADRPVEPVEGGERPVLTAVGGGRAADDERVGIAGHERQAERRRVDGLAGCERAPADVEAPGFEHGAVRRQAGQPGVAVVVGHHRAGGPERAVADDDRARLDRPDEPEVHVLVVPRPGRARRPGTALVDREHLGRADGSAARDQGDRAIRTPGDRHATIGLPRHGRDDPQRRDPGGRAVGVADGEERSLTQGVGGTAGDRHPAVGADGEGGRRVVGADREAGDAVAPEVRVRSAVREQADERQVMAGRGRHIGGTQDAQPVVGQHGERDRVVVATRSHGDREPPVVTEGRVQRPVGRARDDRDVGVAAGRLRATDGVEAAERRVDRRAMRVVDGEVGPEVERVDPGQREHGVDGEAGRRVLRRGRGRRDQREGEGESY